MFRIILKLVGLGSAAMRLAAAPTLEVQRREWEAAWPVGPTGTSHACRLDVWYCHGSWHPS